MNIFNNEKIIKMIASIEDEMNVINLHLLRHIPQLYFTYCIEIVFITRFH